MASRWELPHVQLERQRWRAAIRRFYLGGLTSQSEMAVAMGVSVPTVTKYLKEVQAELKAECEADGEHAKSRLKAMYYELYRQVEMAYQLSRGGVEEEDTEDITCEECNGDGRTEERPNKWFTCSVCDGSGYTTRDVTRIVAQGPGDASFLRVKKEILTELGKLDGLSAGTLSARVMRQAIEATGDKGLEAQSLELWFDGPTDMVIDTLGAIERFRERLHDPQKVIESTTVVSDESRDSSEE